MKFSKRSVLVFGLVIGILAIALTFQTQVFAKEKVIIYARPLVGQMDPGPSGKSESVQNMSLVYNTLVMLDREGRVIPDLAESWDVSPDYKTYTFRLRKGVKFHDGTPFNAQAVKFSYDRMLRVNRTSFGYYLKYADKNSCEVVDDHTIKIHLLKPYPIFPVDATTAAYFILSPDYVKKHATSDDPEALKWMSHHACGTGPFELVEWTEGQRLVFEKFDDYWGGSEGGRTTARVDKVIYKIVDDPSTARLMLEKGDVDIAEKLTVEQFEKLKTTPGIQVINFNIPKAVYITMDVSKPPFNDTKVRRAISHAINYEEIIEYIERKNVKRMHGLIPKGIMAHNPSLPLYRFDLSKAEELMKASGHPNGFTTDLVFALERRPEFEQVGEYIQAYLKKIGINVKIQKIAFDAQIAKMEKGDYGMSLMTWTCVMPDPDDIAGWLYDSARASGGWNGSYWQDKDVQAKLAKCREIADQEQRKALYKEVDRKAVDQAIYVYLYQLTNQFAVRKNIKDFYYDSFMKCYFWNTEKE